MQDNSASNYTDREKRAKRIVELHAEAERLWDLPVGSDVQELRTAERIHEIWQELRTLETLHHLDTIA